MHSEVRENLTGAADGDDRKDEDAIARAYRLHAAWGLQLATNLVGRAEAGDVVHDVFASATHRLDAVPEEEWRPYLARSIVNRSRSRRRRARVAGRFVPGRRRIERSAEDLALLADGHRTVIAAIDRLTERQRECVVLRFFEDLDEAGIAAATGVSRRTVRTHLERALARLADELEPS